MAIASNIVFLDVLVENDDAWIHLYGTYTTRDGVARDADDGYEITPTHIVAWRPITGEDKATVDMDITFGSSSWLQSNYALALGLGRLSLVPTRQAMVVARDQTGLARAGDQAWKPADKLATAPLSWRLSVSAVPVIVELKVELSPPPEIPADRKHEWVQLSPRGSCPTVCGASASVLVGAVRCVAANDGLGSVEVILKVFFANEFC